MLKPDLSLWFTEEVKPHEASLRSYLRNKFPTMPDVDDLVQEAYVRLIRAKESGHIACVRAFLFTTARNVALDLFRREKVITMEAVGDFTDMAVADTRFGVSESISKQQELELLAESIRQLPDRCREVLTLRLLYGLPQKEVAARLNISPNTVKAQLAKGMRRCMDYFVKRGVISLRRQPAAKTTP